MKTDQNERIDRETAISVLEHLIENEQNASKLNSLRNAYNSLVENEKAKVSSYEDLDNVEHFGPKTLDAIREHLRVHGGDHDDNSGNSKGSEQRRKVR